MYDTTKSVSNLLQTAFQQNQLDVGITAAMLPALAQALEPVIAHYIAKKNTLPTLTIFSTMVNNFVQDGPRVQGLSATQHHDEQRLWADLHQQLGLRAQRKWPQLSQEDRAEIVDESWQRIQRYLPGFLFLARFSTWAETILQTRGVDWLAKHQMRLQRELSLDQPAPGAASTDAGTLGELLPGDGELLEEQWAHAQLVQEVRQQLQVLCDAETLQVIRLLSEGYKQVEVAKELQLSNAKVTRLKQAAHEQIVNDEQMRRLATQLGLRV